MDEHSYYSSDEERSAGDREGTHTADAVVADELTAHIINFLRQPALIPDNTSNLHEYQKFFTACINWANLFIAWPPIVDEDVCVLAQHAAQRIRDINVVFGDSFTIDLPTETRLMQAETLMHALARVGVVGSGATVLRCFGSYTSMDMSVLHYRLGLSTVPVLRMSLSDVQAHLLVLCARWKSLEYSEELALYVNLLEMRIFYLVSHIYSEYVMNDRRYAAFAAGLDTNLTMDEVRTAVAERDKRKEALKLAHYIAENHTRVSTADMRTVIDMLDKTETALAKREDTRVVVKPLSAAVAVPATGRVSQSVEIKLDIRPKNEYSKKTRSTLLENARAAVLSSLQTGNVDEIDRAAEAMQNLMRTETTAHEYIAAHSNEIARSAAESGAALAPKTVNSEFVLEVYTIMSELTADIAVRERFASTLTIGSHHELVAAFGSKSVPLTDHVVDMAYTTLCIELDKKIGLVQKNEGDDIVVEKYFQAMLHVGELQREVRHDRDADTDAHAVIYKSRPEEYNKIAEDAQRTMPVLCKCSDAPVVIKDIIYILAFESVIRQETGNSFTELFVSSGKSVNVKTPRPYPIFAKVFHRYRIFDQGVLITFTDFRVAFLYWILRVLFDDSLDGAANGVGILTVVEILAGNLVELYYSKKQKRDRKQKRVAGVL